MAFCTSGEESAKTQKGKSIKKSTQHGGEHPQKAGVSKVIPLRLKGTQLKVRVWSGLKGSNFEIHASSNTGSSSEIFRIGKKRVSHGRERGKKTSCCLERKCSVLKIEPEGKPR